ncbi:MAG TPA: MFS transporter [Bryobacteraceae bacterium]
MTEPKQTVERWPLLLVSFTVLMVAFCACRFSLPIFYPVFIKRFGWNHAQVVGGGSIVLLLIGVLGPLIGWLADKFSPKAVLLAGMCVCASSMALLSTTHSLAQWYAFCMLLGAGIASVSLVPASMLIAPWFTKRRGLAVGVINAGVGAGGAIIPNLTRSWIQLHGYSEAFLLLACTLAIPFLLTLLLVRGSFRRRTVHAPATPAMANDREVLKTSLFWIFGMSVFFAAHTQTGIQENLTLYLTGQGVSSTNAAFALSVLLGASAFGKLLGGVVADRFSTRVSLIMSNLWLVLGIAGLLTVDPHSPVIYALAALFGLGFGGIFNAPSLIAFEYFGTQKVGTILGLFMMFFGLGTSSGSLTAGAIYDQTHRYTAAFTVDLLSCTVAFVLLFAVGRKPAPRPAPLAAAVKKTA